MKFKIEGRKTIFYPFIFGHFDPFLLGQFYPLFWGHFYPYLFGHNLENLRYLKSFIQIRILVKIIRHLKRLRLKLVLGLLPLFII